MYPVEPQSLQTEWALFGSHGWFVYWASRFEKLGSLRQVELGEQAELDHLRDVHPGGDDDVVAAGALGGVELGDHLLVRGVDVDLGRRAVVVGELLEELGVVVLRPVVEVELVLQLGGHASGGTGCAGVSLAPVPRSLPHAASSTLPENSATAPPCRNSRRDTRWAVLQARGSWW